MNQRRPPALLLGALLTAVVCWPDLAPAQAFAPAPDEQAMESSYRVEDPRSEESRARYIESEEGWSRAATAGSTLRFHIGPALLLSPSNPGLLAALDVGERAVGARFSAAWLRAESARGLSSYAAELWIDFRHRHALHPILGAGASFLRGDALAEAKNAGAGVVRGALEYELPVTDADARVGLDLVLLVPAIGVERSKPWALGAVTVSAGF